LIGRVELIENLQPATGADEGVENRKKSIVYVCKRTLIARAYSLFFTTSPDHNKDAHSQILRARMHIHKYTATKYCLHK
jgi:hypothetical protein